MNKNLIGIIALLAGGVGIHKFMLGKVGQGFLYLIFFWTYIPALIAFIEAIRYFCMSQENFDALYFPKKQ